MQSYHREIQECMWGEWDEDSSSVCGYCEAELGGWEAWFSDEVVGV